MAATHLSGREKPSLNLHVEMLPPKCDDPYFVKTLNDKPGILALAMDRKVDPATGKVSLEAIPFIVPGARFNEKYGWDSVSLTTILPVTELMSVLHGFGPSRRRQD